MVRPCFLVVDREFPGNISTRKLILETAKYNVITAYSAQEAIEMLHVFPNVTAVVMDSHQRGMPCGELIQKLRGVRPHLPVVVTESPGVANCEGPTHVVPFYTPQALLQAVASIVPQETTSLIEHERAIKEDDVTGN